MSKTKSYTYLIHFGITYALAPVSMRRCVHTTDKRISTAQDIEEIERNLHEIFKISNKCNVELYSFSLMSEEGMSMTKKWRFRDDMLGHYINDSSNRTFQDAEDRLNHLEEKAQLPDMRSKVSEYILELDEEISRCHNLLEHSLDDESTLHSRISTLTEVKNDLQSRLEELV